jgi:hypothetical protein
MVAEEPLNREARGYTETSVTSYQTTAHLIPEGVLHSPCLENLRFPAF